MWADWDTFSYSKHCEVGGTKLFQSYVTNISHALKSFQ